MRRFRSFIAMFVIGALAFAQGVTAAHACAIATGGAAAPSNVSHGAHVAALASMPADCAMHAHRAAPPANDCVAHCVTAQQANAAAVEVCAPPLTRIALVVATTTADGAARDVRPALPPPPAAAPPPRLRFARFLV